jgi:hypothetical protein
MLTVRNRAHDCWHRRDRQSAVAAGLGDSLTGPRPIRPVAVPDVTLRPRPDPVDWPQRWGISPGPAVWPEFSAFGRLDGSVVPVTTTDGDEEVATWMASSHRRDVEIAIARNTMSIRAL